MKDMKLSDIEFNSTLCYKEMPANPLIGPSVNSIKAYNESELQNLKELMLERVTAIFRDEMKLIIDTITPYHDTIDAQTPNYKTVMRNTVPTLESSLDIQVRVYERSSTDGPCKDFRYDYEKDGNISTFDKIEYWGKRREMESK